MGPQLKIAALLAAIAGGVLWVESGRVVIEPSQAMEQRPCPDSDAMPYTARCIEFMLGQTRPLAVVPPNAPLILDVELLGVN